MASRALTSAVRGATSRSLLPTSRSFTTSLPRLQDVTPPPPKKPVGAFRGGLLGFFLGSTVAGATVYYYILQEYKISNELLTEDIYSLQAATQRIHSYVSELENKVAQMEKKK